MRQFIAHFLFVLAAWTLIIKYIFPVAFALADGSAPLAYVLWDFWWVAHIWLGVELLSPRAHTLALALVVSVVEIAIVVTKFVFFLGDPTWDIWMTNWFINKVFVLACFVLLLGYTLRDRAALRPVVVSADLSPRSS